MSVFASVFHRNNTVEVDDNWTEVIRFEFSNKRPSSQHLSVLMQGDDATKVKFRVRVQHKHDDSRPSTIKKYAAIGVEQEPQPAQFDAEFDSYIIEARTASGTAQASAFIRAYDMDDS